MGCHKDKKVKRINKSYALALATLNTRKPLLQGITFIKSVAAARFKASIAVFIAVSVAQNTGVLAVKSPTTI